jgi:CP family cyanate transporter-like MFS transporter
VTIYFGLQSALFYSFAAWLPTLLTDAGLSAGEGGLLLGLNNLVAAAGALVAPALAGRMRTQRPLLAVVITAHAVGLAGLLLAPQEAPSSG